MQEEALEKFEVDGLTVKIFRDNDATSPADWSYDGLFLIGNHRDFYVKPPGVKDRHWDVESVMEQYAKTHRIYPIEAYIHGGVALYLRGKCMIDRQWDVSQVGAVFVSKKEWRYEKKAFKAAEALIKGWNQYLSGDVYNYVIKDEDGDHLDSCSGFYGEEHVREEATAVAKSLAKDIRTKKQARLKAKIKNKVPLSKR